MKLSSQTNFLNLFFHVYLSDIDDIELEDTILFKLVTSRASAYQERRNWFFFHSSESLKCFSSDIHYSKEDQRTDAKTCGFKIEEIKFSMTVCN